jgi:hypothetical protein
MAMRVGIFLLALIVVVASQAGKTVDRNTPGYSGWPSREVMLAATLPAAKALAATQPAMAVPADWIAPVAPRDWQWIIIHHSATTFGNAAIIDAWHRQKGWDELGYHFVVGNGSNSGNGQVEVGPRWIKQKWGAHTRTPDNRFNETGIGICVVGNFDFDHPTAAQMQSLARLVAYLMKTYKIPPERVIGHGQAKPTDCPGRFMNVLEVRRLALAILTAEAGGVRKPAN